MSRPEERPAPLLEHLDTHPPAAVDACRSDAEQENEDRWEVRTAQTDRAQAVAFIRRPEQQA